MKKTLLSAALAAGLLLGASLPALAEGVPATAAAPAAAEGARIEVTVIHATRDGQLDPALAGLKRTLERAFSGYAGFAKLGEQRETLALDGEQRLTLPNESELVYRYLGTDPDGFLRVHIEVGGLRSTVRVKDGGTFFQAGRGYKDGMIVLAFRAAIAR